MYGCGAAANGFTLFELLVVLLIIGLAAAFTVPNLAGSLTGMNLRTSAKKISAALRFARSRAVSEMRPYSAFFDLDKNRFSIVTKKQDDDGLNLGKEEDTEDSDVIKTYDLPEGVKIEKAGTEKEMKETGVFIIDFLPSGGNTGGKIVVGNEKKRKFEIIVNFITGAVKTE